MSELEIKPENYYLDVLQNPDYYLTGEKPIYKKVIKEAYSREQVLKLLEPQLTIPKIVIEYYESGDNLYLSWLYANDMLKVNDEQALKKREDEIIRRKAILQAYLAGKALGVELVKVVEND